MKYPVDVYELSWVQDGCVKGVKIMRKSDSEASSRVFERMDGDEMAGGLLIMNIEILPLPAHIMRNCA